MGAVVSKPACCIEMQTIILPLLLLLAEHSRAHPMPDAEEESLKEEIAVAAEESRALADELAEMLARLDDNQDPIQRYVDPGDDGSQVEGALKLLVSKIRELAVVSAKSEELNIPQAVKERELKTTLAEIEF